METLHLKPFQKSPTYLNEGLCLKMIPGYTEYSREPSQTLGKKSLPKALYSLM